MVSEPPSSAVRLVSPCWLGRGPGRDAFVCSWAALGLVVFEVAVR